jgi:hypothetical protein
VGEFGFVEVSPEFWEARKNVVRNNATIALFSFSAACIVLIGSFVGLGGESAGDSLFVEARTVVLVLLLLLIFQSVYYYLVSKNVIHTSARTSRYPLLDVENTYFVSLAAAASACVYVLSVVANVSNAVSALAASVILTAFFIIQLIYLAVSERYGKTE